MHFRVPIRVSVVSPANSGSDQLVCKWNIAQLETSNMKFTALVLYSFGYETRICYYCYLALCMKLNSAGCLRSSRSSIYPDQRQSLIITSIPHLDNTVTAISQRYTQNDSRLEYTTSINSRLLHRFHAREHGSKAALSYFYPITSKQGISAAVVLVRVEMGL